MPLRKAIFMNTENTSELRKYFAEFGIGILAGLLLLTSLASCIGFADSIADTCNLIIVSLSSVAIFLIADEATH